ncbi:MAG TPA: hypothetical protein VMM27_09785 [Casimicrobiaceae bacterium]|nr:hypothetical protein [Casimicrobiaceae bacterium]
MPPEIGSPATEGASTTTCARRTVDHSACDARALRALEDFADRVLSLAQGAERILDALQADPDEPSLRLAAAFFWLFGQTAQAQTEAARHLDVARAGASRLNPRERAWLHALDAWHAKAFDAAATRFEAITAAWGADLLALRAAEFLYYVLGQQHCGPRYAAHTERLAVEHGADPDFLAMHAFANELCGRMDAARRHAEQAIGLRARNPWAQHALAHVFAQEGNVAAAAALMERWLADWPRSARTVYCHDAWHLALLHLDRLEVDRAFAVYDEHVWGRTPDSVVEQLDAIAFLWRAEMAGVAVEAARWRSILPHVRSAWPTLFMPFVSAHYAYALARAGDVEEAEALLRLTDARAAQDDEEALRVWRPAGRGIVRAAARLGSDDARAAADELEPVMSLMTRIGGSDAQDDLFRFAFVDSLSRCGRRADAAAYLRGRMSRKPASPLEVKLLGALT